RSFSRTSQFRETAQLWHGREKEPPGCLPWDLLPFSTAWTTRLFREQEPWRCRTSPSKDSRLRAETETAVVAEGWEQVERCMSVRLARVCQLSQSTTAHSIPTALRAARVVQLTMGALLEVAAAVDSSEMGEAPALTAVVAEAAARAGMAAKETKAEAAEVEPSSAVETTRASRAVSA